MNLGVVTNDIFTREDQEFLIRNSALTPTDRVQAIETGGCPHAAIREDISSNLEALEQLQAKYNCEMLFVESGGDNLAASYSSELADLHVYVIDVSGGDKVGQVCLESLVFRLNMFLHSLTTGASQGRPGYFTVRYPRHQQD